MIESEDLTMRERILEVMRASGHPMDAREVWAQIGGDDLHVKTTLYSMAMTGAVVRVGSRERLTLYALPESRDAA